MILKKVGKRQGICTVMHREGPSSKLLSSTDLKLGSYAGADSLLGMQTCVKLLHCYGRWEHSMSMGKCCSDLQRRDVLTSLRSGIPRGTELNCLCSQYPAHTDCARAWSLMNIGKKRMEQGKDKYVLRIRLS